MKELNELNINEPEMTVTPMSSGSGNIYIVNGGYYVCSQHMGTYTDPWVGRPVPYVYTYCDFYRDSRYNYHYCPFVEYAYDYAFYYSSDVYQAMNHFHGQYSITYDYNGGGYVSPYEIDRRLPERPSYYDGTPSSLSWDDISVYRGMLLYRYNTTKWTWIPRLFKYFSSGQYCAKLFALLKSRRYPMDSTVTVKSSGHVYDYYNNLIGYLPEGFQYGNYAISYSYGYGYCPGTYSYPEY